MRSISVLNLLRKGSCTVVIAVCVTLAGCQMMDSKKVMEATYIDPDDPCRSERSQLIASTPDPFSNIAAGALITTLPVLLNDLQSGDKDIAEIVERAIIFGLAGAAGGYFVAKMKQTKNREELRDAINSDVQSDTHKVTEMRSILRNLNECRQSQVADVRRDFNDGRVTAQKTKAKLQTVRASIQGDNELLEEILGEMTERKGVYVATISQVEDKAEEDILADADASTSVRQLDRASREVRNEHQMASADLFREIDELAELTLV